MNKIDDTNKTSNMNYDNLSDEEKMEHAGVRPTAMRLLIYRTICASHHPLSSLDMETGLETADRSTISRTLSTFLEHGLIHAINDGSGSVKYEVCRANHNHADDDMHVHFHCRICGKTYCLPHAVPAIEIPDGFIRESANYVVSGKCKRCAFGS